jgi:UPF0716 family protein affecting phage T7 exclusion
MCKPRKTKHHVVLVELADPTKALPPAAQIALATLLLSLPGVIATIVAAVVSWQTFRQSQALCQFGMYSFSSEGMLMC